MHGVLGRLVHGWACAYMVVWYVIYCLPYSLPTDAQGMNYSVLILGGLTVLVGLRWMMNADKRCLMPVRMEFMWILKVASPLEGRMRYTSLHI